MGLTNRYFDNDNDESDPNSWNLFFLSGSLHFGIKFYCCDEDESSELLFFFRAFRTAAAAADTCCWVTFCRRTVGWD